MNEKDLFIAALQKSRADRSAFLDEACENNQALRARIQVLLEEHERPDGMLDRLATRPTSEAIGSPIGPYQLLEKIGEGAVGAVYVADQARPVRRRVAIKIIKPGMDSDHVVARFEAERQALALMDHPNIAKIFDAGTTDSGRPFFVMELVAGVPITEYCDRERLSTRDRLELFVTVCRAVQHAHQKGIIHRDIKPSNVMVAPIDGMPVPKIIDFGVAKAIEQRLTERTVFTQPGLIVGTLEYMSPEQAELSGLDIDTRADIYALGAMLYELLAGSTPLQRTRVRESAYFDIIRRIREEDPPTPSARLLGSGDRLTSIAAQRGTEPSRLIRAVLGDLGWIVMKALEKDRTRRYETANAFARDIRRFLDNEAVEASPPSASYRFRKFLRRNRGPAIAVALLLLGLMGSVVGTTVGMLRAEKLRGEAEAAREAEARLRKAAEASERREREATDDAKAILSFLQEKILAAGRPDGMMGGLGKDVTLRQAIDAAAVEIRTSFRDRPIVEASLSRYVGDTYTYLGEFRRSLPFFERVLELRRSALGDAHPDTLVSMQDLGDNYLDVHRYDRALPLFEEMKAHRLRDLGPAHHLTLAVDNLMARYHHEYGAPRTFLPVLEQTLSRLRATYGDDAEATQKCLFLVGLLAIDAGRYERAVDRLEEALELTKARLGADHMLTDQYSYALAEAYRFAGENARAVALLTKTLASQRARLGPDHQDPLASSHLLGICYEETGDFDRSLSMLDQVVRRSRLALGPDHPLTIASPMRLGLAYLAAGEPSRALPLVRQSHELSRAMPESEAPVLLVSLYALGSVHAALGDRHLARRFHEDALRRQEIKLGADHPETLRTADALGWDRINEGKPDDAIELLRRNLERREAVLKPMHPDVSQGLHSLGVAYLGAGKPDRALPYLERALERRRVNSGDEHPETLKAMDSLGMCLLAVGRPAAAESILREDLSLRERRSKDAWATFHCTSLLGSAMLAQKKFAEAERLLVSGYEGLKAREARITPVLRSSCLVAAADRIVRLYEDRGDAKAATWWRTKLGLGEFPANVFACP